MTVLQQIACDGEETEAALQTGLLPTQERRGFIFIKQVQLCPDLILIHYLSNPLYKKAV